MRRGRYTAQQTDALKRLSGEYLADAEACRDLRKLFAGRPVVLEIGFGMGEATWQLAQRDPEMGILAVDVHTPGVGKLLAQIEHQHLQNVRIHEGDAVELLQHAIPSRSLSGVRIFFPDPWPKTKHHKRRLVSEATLTLLADRLVPGGFLHFATDWLDYAEVVRDLLEASDDFELRTDLVIGADPKERPRTGYESRGVAAGRPITDLVATTKPQ